MEWRRRQSGCLKTPLFPLRGRPEAAPLYLRGVERSFEITRHPAGQARGAASLRDSASAREADVSQEGPGPAALPEQGTLAATGRGLLQARFLLLTRMSHRGAPPVTDRRAALLPRSHDWATTLCPQTFKSRPGLNPARSRGHVKKALPGRGEHTGIWTWCGSGGGILPSGTHIY